MIYAHVARDRQISTEELARLVLAAELIEAKLEEMEPVVVMAYERHYRILLEYIEVGRHQQGEALRKRDASIGGHYGSQIRTEEYRSREFDSDYDNVDEYLFNKKKWRPEDQDGCV